MNQFGFQLTQLAPTFQHPAFFTLPVDRAGLQAASASGPVDALRFGRALPAPARVEDDAAWAEGLDEEPERWDGLS